MLSEVDFSTFDYISLSDQDDIWFKDKLTSCIEKMTNENADACSSDVVAFWGDEAATSKKKYIQKSQMIGKWNHHFESAGPGCTFVIKNKVAEELKLFLIANAANLPSLALHDWLIFSFAISRRFKWVILPKATILYRQHATNVIGANTGLKSYLKRVNLLKSGWYLSQVSLISDLCGNSNKPPILQIKELTFKNLIFILKNMRHMRRKLTDRLVLATFFIYLFFSHPRTK